MRKILVSISLIFIFFLPIKLSAAGQENDWQKFYNQSFEYFYNWQFNKAIECLEKARELNPGNPAIYWRLTYVLGFEANERTRISKKERKELEEAFNKIFNKGIALCDSSSTNSETLFYFGGLYGNRVFFKQAIGQGNLSMLSDVEKAQEHLGKIKETEDFYYEARGYLGLLNCGPIIMSAIQRMAVKAAGCKWNKELGLQQIKDAMRNSRYSDDIKDVYRGTLQTMIEKNKFKDRISEAIELAEDLLKKYPNNLKSKLDLVILYWKKGELVKANEMGYKLCKELLLFQKDPRFSKSPHIKCLYVKLAGIRSRIKEELKNKE